MEIPGYDYGRVPTSPVTIDALHMLEVSAGLTDSDRRYLALAADVLSAQAEAMVDAWRAVIGSHEHLSKWFFGPDGKPDEQYKAAIKRRFVQWVKDVGSRSYDQAWLDYQDEIGRRHTPEKKNATDEADTPPVVPLRYLVAFAGVVVTTAAGFLRRGGHTAEEVAAMHSAWTKAVMLSLALWARPYAKDGLW